MCKRRRGAVPEAKTQRLGGIARRRRASLSELPRRPDPDRLPSPGSEHQVQTRGRIDRALGRSEEHTSELQSRLHLVCRLLLEKKKKQKQTNTTTHTGDVS